MKKETLEEKDYDYVFVYTHADETCSLPSVTHSPKPSTMFGWHLLRGLLALRPFLKIF